MHEIVNVNSRQIYRYVAEKNHVHGLHVHYCRWINIMLRSVHSRDSQILYCIKELKELPKFYIFKAIHGGLTSEKCSDRHSVCTNNYCWQMNYVAARFDSYDFIH